MPRPRPLTPAEAKRTLANRFNGRVDRLRQLNTRFGVRSRRVFLVHTAWDGETHSEGNERVISRVELLPTPRVADASTINQRPWSGGTLPEGTIRVDEISAQQCTPDVLTGVRLAHRDGHAFGCACGQGCAPEPRLPPNVSFFYEIVEDGRGDELPYRERYRLFGRPWRREGGFQFSLLLEAASEPLDRLGESTVQDHDL